MWETFDECGGSGNWCHVERDGSTHQKHAHGTKECACHGFERERREKEWRSRRRGGRDGMNVNETIVSDEMRYGVNVHWEEENTETAQNRCGEFVAVMTWGKWHSELCNRQRSILRIMWHRLRCVSGVIRLWISRWKRRMLRILMLSVSILKKYMSSNTKYAPNMQNITCMKSVRICDKSGFMWTS